jgi:hypothetical protein
MTDMPVTANLDILRRNPAFVEAERQALFAASCGNRDSYTKATATMYELAHIDGAKLLKTFVTRDDVLPMLNAHMYVIDVQQRHLHTITTSGESEAIRAALTTRTQSPTPAPTSTAPRKAYSGSRQCFVQSPKGLLGPYASAQDALTALGLPKSEHPAVVLQTAGYTLIRSKDMPK